MSNESASIQALIPGLLAAKTPVQRRELLAEAELLNAAGFQDLLSYIRQAARRSVAEAGTLIDIVEPEARASEDFFSLLPHFSYLRAQLEMLQGRFEPALQLVSAAQDGFLAQGDTIQAAQTAIGRISILGQSGRLTEAIETAGQALESLESADGDTVDSIRIRLLQNRTNCYELMGQYVATLDDHERIEQTLLRLNLPGQAAGAKLNHAVTLLSLGRGHEAIPLLTESAAQFETLGRINDQGRALNSLGSVQTLLGEFHASLETLQQAQVQLTAAGFVESALESLTDQANVYLTLNLLSEANNAYQTASQQLAELGITYHTARALSGLGQTQHRSGNSLEALNTLERAGSMFSDLDNLPSIAQIEVTRAGILREVGRLDESQEALNQALAILSQHNAPVQTIWVHFGQCDLSLARAQYEQAEQALLAAAPIVEELALPQLSFRLAQRWGQWHRAQGNNVEANRHLETSIGIIEQMRGTLQQENLRSTFLQDKLTAYEELLELYLSTKSDLTQALAVAERARSRALVDRMISSVDSQLGQISTDDESTALQTQAELRTLRQSLNALYNSLLGNGSGERRGAVDVSGIQARAAELEQEINRLRLQHTQSQNHIEWESTPWTLANLRDSLPTDTPVIIFHTLRDEILAFIWQNGQLELVRNAGTVSQVLPHLARYHVQLRRLRAGGNFVKRRIEQLELSTRRVLQQLYNTIWTQVADRLPTTNDQPRPIIIIPHGALHRVPFHALHDGNNYLIDHYNISYAPGLRVLALCQQRAARPLKRAAIFGIGDATIRGVTTEVNAISTQFSDVQTRLNDEATLAQFETNAQQVDVLHIAAHGIFRSDNPMYSALKLADHWLTAGEIMGMQLDNQLATLSACESGRTHVTAGDEMMGLPRAFLGAGVASLVVSLWLVQDNVSAEFMPMWYQKLRETDDFAAALCETQRIFKEKYRHPYYWAPFILTGKRGRV